MSQLIAVTMEAAAPNQFRDVSPLALSVAPKLYRFMYCDDIDLFERVTETVWRAPQGINSFNAATVARAGAQVLGFEQGGNQESWDTSKRQMAVAVKELCPPDTIHHMVTHQWELKTLAPDLPKHGYYLASIAVALDAQGRGIGKLLIENAVAKARALACTSIHLDVRANNPAVNLYRHMGFDTLSEVRLPRLEAAGDIGPHYRMELRLD